MGANVNERTRFGDTPLHYASTLGRVDVVRVDAGALVDTTNNCGYTPLYCAIRGFTPLYCDFAPRADFAAVALLLVDRGATASNVKLDMHTVPAIPDCVTTFIESRSKCRCATISIIGIHKYLRTTVTGNNDINVMKLISKHIWSTRMDVDVWITPPIEAETKKVRRNPKHGSTSK
jgi:hypothetical protein